MAGLDRLAVDTDPALVTQIRGEGRNIYWGNASRPEFLARCGLDEAKALIITMDKPADAENIVRGARVGHPDLAIAARARDAHHATILLKLSFYQNTIHLGPGENELNPILDLGR